MKIPDRIKIGGLWYDVELTENIDCCGLLERPKCKIKIDKNMRHDVQELTLFHEVGHAINSELDDVQIDFIAQAFYQVLKDNNLLREEQ